MTDQLVGSDEPYPSEAQMPTADGDLNGLTPDLDEDMQLVTPGWDEITTPRDLHGVSPMAVRWSGPTACWRRLGVAILALLALVASALLPSSQSALAET